MSKETIVEDNLDSHPILTIFKLYMLPYIQETSVVHFLGTFDTTHTID